MLKKWYQYENEQPVDFGKHNLWYHIYRLYLLALYGKPNLGQMNLIRENELDKLSNTQRWMFGATYYLAGEKETAEGIVLNVSHDVEDYRSYSYSYGSSFRDQAVILYAMTIMKRHPQASDLFDEIVKTYNGKNRYYSTQTDAWALMAVGHFMDTYREDFENGKEIKGWTRIDGGKEAVVHLQG